MDCVGRPEAARGSGKGRALRPELRAFAHGHLLARTRSVALERARTARHSAQPCVRTICAPQHQSSAGRVRAARGRPSVPRGVRGWVARTTTRCGSWVDLGGIVRETPARLVRETIARNHHSEGRGRTENGTTQRRERVCGPGLDVTKRESTRSRRPPRRAPRPQIALSGPRGSTPSEFVGFGICACTTGTSKCEALFAAQGGENTSRRVG